MPTQTLRGTVESVRRDGTAFKLNGDWVQRSQYGYSGPAFDGLYQQNVVVEANPGKQGGYFATKVSVVKEPGQVDPQLTLNRRSALAHAVETCNAIMALDEKQGLTPGSWVGKQAVLALASGFEEWLTREPEESFSGMEEPPPPEEEAPE